MCTLSVILHGRLRDFLPSAQWETPVETSCRGGASLKHVIESMGVPHPETGRVTVNGAPADLSRRMRGGERVEVFPIEGFTGHEARFVADVHLGRLARYLRLLGFDTAYSNRADDPHLAARSAREDRILLTRDRALLFRACVRQGYFVRSGDARGQLDEVVRRYELRDRVMPFARCLRCNGALESVEKSAVLERIPPKTRLWLDEYFRCTGCDQLFWPGSHHARMLEFLESAGLYAPKARRA
jgi:uncharacterized protein with PIN domain